LYLLGWIAVTPFASKSVNIHGNSQTSVFTHILISCFKSFWHKSCIILSINVTSFCGRLRSESVHNLLVVKCITAVIIIHTSSKPQLKMGRNWRQIMCHISGLVVGVLLRSVFCNRHYSVTVWFFYEGVFHFSVLEKEKQTSHKLGPCVAPSSSRITSSPNLHSLFYKLRHWATSQAGFTHTRNSTSILWATT
jgi:hypothetical protein